jgi:glycosyltransferase involved in cell wall biosynthesis
MVVVEAYALGVPIVASRIGSLEEVIIEGETGVRTPFSSLNRPT